MQANVPIKDTIIDIEGISVARKSCKKKYTTSITSRMATIRVSSTLAIEASKKSFELCISTNSRPAGKS